MKTYIAKRVLLMIPTLVGITLLTYAIVRLAPGDPIEAMILAQSGNIDPKAMRADAERIRQRLGLKDINYWGDDVESHLEALEKGDEAAQARAAAELARVTGQGFGRDLAAWKQWWLVNGSKFSRTLIDPAEKVINVFHGYARWGVHIAAGDFGESIKYRTSSGSRNPILLFLERIPITLTLNIIAEVIIFVIAIPVGLASARYQGRLFDRLSTLALLALWSIPVILAGPVLLGLLGRGGLGVEWFPVAGLHTPDSEKWSWWAYWKDTFWHAMLPVACMVYGGLAYLAKLGRASLLENLRSDYVRTARAKGLPESRVVYHHALRNSLLPMVTTMVLILPGLIGGSVIVETIFSIPGMGLLTVDAAKAYDLSVVMTGTLTFGFLTLLALLVGDVMYALVDPRVRYE